MDLFGGPAADGVAAMQQDFHQADDAGVVDFDAGIADRADGNGQGKPLEQRKVDVHVEALSLEAGEAVGNGENFSRTASEMIQAFLQAEVGQVVGAEPRCADSVENFSYCLMKALLPVGAENVMAVLDLFDRPCSACPSASCEAHAEDLGDLVGRQAPQADFAAALEDLVDGEVALEDEVPAVFDLADGIEAAQVHRRCVLFWRTSAPA